MIARAQHLLQSLTLKFALLIAIFLIIPTILFIQFRSDTSARTRLLEQNLADQGELILRALEPELENFSADPPDEIQTQLERIGDRTLRLKLFYRPADTSDGDSLFYIASQPTLKLKDFGKERKDLIEAGLFDELNETCDIRRSLALSYTNVVGEGEFLTSMNSTRLNTGCWILLTSVPRDGALVAQLIEPFWSRPAVRTALAVYLFMALLAIWSGVDVFRVMRKFAIVARHIRRRVSPGASFENLTSIPELKTVATEFDRLVRTQEQSRELMRTTADQTAHALKGPLAVIFQALEPLKRESKSLSEGSCRSVQMIETSVERLDNLVSQARDLDAAAADTLDLALRPVQLSRYLNQFIDQFEVFLDARNLSVTRQIAPNVVVPATEEGLETILENIFDNAVAFAPPDSTLTVSLQADRTTATLSIADEGPGASPTDLAKLFDKYFTSRPDKQSERHEPPNFGLGLWIVQRYVNAFDGTVTARNREQGGLEIVIALSRVSI